MRVAYVDTSFIVAVALGEPNSDALAATLMTFERVTSAALMEAELRATLKREVRALDERLINRVECIMPPRPLGSEIARVLDAGYVSGADCFHLATALYLAPEPGAMTFLTLDSRQRAVAKALGFKT